MNQLLRLLPILLLASAMTCWAQPTQAARLASVAGRALEEESFSDDFNLTSQTTITIAYDVEAITDECAVQVLVYREQNDGRWLVVNTVTTTTGDINGSNNITLRPGNYRVTVIARQAEFDVSVDS